MIVAKKLKISKLEFLGNYDDFNSTLSARINCLLSDDTKTLIKTVEI